MEGCSLRDAALPVRDWSGTMSLRRAGPADERPQAAPNAPLHFALQYIDGHHPYLATRGLTGGTIRGFGIGAQETQSPFSVLSQGGWWRTTLAPPDGLAWSQSCAVAASQVGICVSISSLVYGQHH
jgi:hypothetical protein